MIRLLLALALTAPAPAALPPEVEAAHASAESAARAGDYRTAARRMAAVVADLEALAADAVPPEEWTRALLRLAVLESTVGDAASARASMERALAIDPSPAADPESFSPAFRRELEAARARVEARPCFTVSVTSRGGEGTAWVQGRAVGPVPAAVRLPAGRWRIGVGSAGAVRSVSVDVSRDEVVVIDRASPLPAPEALAASAPPSEPRPSVESSPPGGWMRPAGWTAVGLAAAAAGIATWQGIAAASSYDRASGMLLPDGSLAPGVDPEAYARASADFANERRNAWIAGGSAVVLGAGAAVLLLLAPSAPVAPAPGGVAFRF